MAKTAQAPRLVRVPRHITRGSRAGRLRKRVVILGAAGLGRAFYQALVSRGTGGAVVGFLDDGRTGSFCGLPILGRCRDLPTLAKTLRLTHVGLGVGYQYFDDRQELIAMVNETGCCAWQSAIHASAIVSPDVQMGQGVYISMGTIVSTGTRIGNYGVIWSGSAMEHDNDIGEDVYIATGVITAGRVTINSHAFIGMGSVVAKCTIGAYATIGAGSVVLEDVPDHTYAWGRPARAVKDKPQPAYV